LRKILHNLQPKHKIRAVRALRRPDLVPLFTKSHSTVVHLNALKKVFTGGIPFVLQQVTACLLCVVISMHVICVYAVVPVCW
jgi:hypothetical protein